MHPALSIIAFSTLSGLGYGLAAMLGLGLLDPAHPSTKGAHLVALAMIAIGLMSSTLHLRNPRRAWRALSQWRSSWLSREGVFALAAFAPLTLSAAATLLYETYSAPLGLAGAALAAATVFSTSMIYASLRAVDAWHTRLTPACYLLFSLAGGLTLASFFAALGGRPIGWLAVWAIVAVIAAWIVKLAWRNRKNTVRLRSTPESATGLGRIGRVRLFERPHTNDNYLTSEMGFRVARKHAAKLFVIAIAAGGVAPVLLLAAAAIAGTGNVAVAFCGLAVVCQGFGIVIERWLFFAEARHAMTNYY